MSTGTPTIRCYLLPIIAALVYLVLSIPLIVEIFYGWIPNQFYNVIIKALIILVITFLACRCIDLYYQDQCH